MQPITCFLAISIAGCAALQLHCKKEESTASDSGLSQADSQIKGWSVLYEETFETTTLGSPGWNNDSYPADGPFSDNGLFFQKKGVKPPQGYRLSSAFGQSGWLTFEAYSRKEGLPFSSMAHIVADPSGKSGKVLRLISPSHTDGIIVRPTQALPKRYRISVRVGYADFGDGKAGSKNGYDGGESAEPWIDADATAENGFYWLAIVDATPRPHNNVWVHHHRKLLIDSDNHYPPWMEIYTGKSFLASGEHPIALFAVDGRGKASELTGKPFISWAQSAWQPSGKIRAVNAYKPQTWYNVSIERNGDRFTVEIVGDFQYGGQGTIRTSIDAASRCVFHYNRTPLADHSPCIDNTYFASLGSGYPHWPKDSAFPDYFFFGDPHINYYEGQVYYDDIKLETFQD